MFCPSCNQFASAWVSRGLLPCSCGHRIAPETAAAKIQTIRTIQTNRTNQNDRTIKKIANLATNCDRLHLIGCNDL